MYEEPGQIDRVLFFISGFRHKVSQLNVPLHL